MNSVSAKQNTGLFRLPANNKDYRRLKNNFIEYKDDIWDFSRLITNNLAGINKNKTLINFSKILEATHRECAKRYTWYLLALGDKKPTTICMYINVHLMANIYVFLEQANIKPQDVNNKTLLEYTRYLGNKNLANMYKATSTRVFIDYINFAVKNEIAGFSKALISLGESPYKYFSNKETGDDDFKDRSIPDAVFNKILDAAKRENIFQLNYQSNKPTTTQKGKCKGVKKINRERFGVIIQAYTGLRISEILTLKINCIELVDGIYWLKYTSSKTKVEPRVERIVVPEIVAKEIEVLTKISQPYRDVLKTENDIYSESIADKLFLISSHSKKRIIGIAKSTGWTKNNLSRFIERNNITHAGSTDDEELYPLRSHQFRHTFAKRLINDGVPLRIIKRHYSHVSIDMTMHYAKINQEKLEKDYIETYLKSDFIYSSGKSGDEFIESIGEAKTEKDIDAVISNLTKRFGINPLPMGMCLLDFKKGYCSHTGSEGCYYSGCGDFVTNVSFIANFKTQREILQRDIKRLWGNNLASMTLKAHQHKLEKLNKIIASLEKEGTYKEGGE